MYLFLLLVGGYNQMQTIKYLISSSILVEYYDQISSGYVELHQDEQLKKIDIIKQNLAINDNDLLLDLGCGPCFGDFPCNRIGIDSSIELLKQANAKVIHGNAEQLPFKDSVFDIVVCMTALHNFKNKEKALLEAKRVGKTKFAFSILRKSKAREEMEKLINKHFTIEKTIEEDKDIILITNYK